MKALVVDDDPTSRLVLESILSHYGAVASCTNGSDAVDAVRRALARRQPFDLISIDLLMPVMNGLEALQLIRQDEESQGQPRASKVIVITSSDTPANINEAFGQLCDAYLVKPVDGQQFLDVLHCLCNLQPA